MWQANIETNDSTLESLFSFGYLTNVLFKTNQFSKPHYSHTSFAKRQRYNIKAINAQA